jgi:hypothetical protein
MYYIESYGILFIVWRDREEIVCLPIPNLFHWLSISNRDLWCLDDDVMLSDTWVDFGVTLVS